MVLAVVFSLLVSVFIFLALSCSGSTFLFRLPPLMLRTKTHSIPKNLQFVQTFGLCCILLSLPFSLFLRLISSPSHLIFFSRHDKHALLATDRLEVEVS